MMSKLKTYKVKRFKTWKSFKDYTDSFSENWIFRGQSDSTWDLNTSLERSGFSTKYDGIESSFFIEFRRTAENFLKTKDIPNDLLEWLALMQHHGAPTRLLDFSKSIFVASYFAFESIESKATHIAIWAIDINKVAQKSTEYLWPHFGESLKKNHGRLTDDLFERVFFERGYECLIPVEPYKMNQRYYLQQSAFVSVGDSRIPFMEQLTFLDSNIDDIIIKMVLPKSMTHEVITDLNKMNINRASLFPDLDGYAKSLKMKYAVMKTMDGRIDEVIKEQEKIHGYKTVKNPIPKLR